MYCSEIYQESPLLNQEQLETKRLVFIADKESVIYIHTTLQFVNLGKAVGIVAVLGIFSVPIRRVSTR
jgi:hypothetical protein